jgi:hypothetical protein
MQTSLQIREIRDMVAGQLDPTHISGSAALAALSRTCKAFNDPALDVLWETQDTILNLMTCFPWDLFPLAGSRTLYESVSKLDSQPECTSFKVFHSDRNSNLPARLSTVIGFGHSSTRVAYGSSLLPIRFTSWSSSRRPFRPTHCFRI